MASQVSAGSIKVGETASWVFWYGSEGRDKGEDRGAQFWMGYPPSGNWPTRLITFDVGMSRTRLNGMNYFASVRNEGPESTNLNFWGGGFL
jgi:hypothetical protein